MKSSQQRQPSHLCHLDAIDQYDDIIDVRTPKEFALDHIPGAINAPVLTDDERVLVGTLYKQQSAFKATREGAALVARHIAEHLETLFAEKPRNWKPLIYCWRGGKRSASMTHWFNLIGWRASQLSGGYKAWRRHVINELERLPPNYRFIILAGPTGSGKTRLLNSLDKAGAQTLDLERLASHRGSLLGALPGCPQPGQKAFETALYTELSALDPAVPVFVEAESRRIGRVDLPAVLMAAMHAGDCVQIKAAMPDRIGFLLQDYAHLFAQPEAFKQKLACLVKLHSKKTISDWQAMIDGDLRAELFHALVQQHYDPAYHRSSHLHYRLDQAIAFDYNPLSVDSIGLAQQLLAVMNLLPTDKQEKLL